jgi:hypothetical protein
MPETCRVSWQNNFWIFDASSWLFYTKLITMHGHLNIKYFLHKFIPFVPLSTCRRPVFTRLHLITHTPQYHRAATRAPLWQTTPWHGNSTRTLPITNSLLRYNTNMSNCLIKHYAMKVYVNVEFSSKKYTYMRRNLIQVSGQLHALAGLISRNAPPGNH